MSPFLILSPFVMVPVAAFMGRRRPGVSALLALWPAGLAVYFVSWLRTIASSGPAIVEWPWAPTLGLTLSFQLDGLGLLFALLITGIGALVVVYGSWYLAGHPHVGRFHATLFAFMGSMLGVVLSDNLFTLFVFWEMTGFTSFLLIGFEHDKAESRASALQALIVTGLGGLALLAGAVLIEQSTGTVRISELLASGTDAASITPYTVITVLFLLAAFTKSAQVPFHFWLPNAMAAPTPVSAYLHSATMVKAGVYLVARMTPILGGTPLWTGLIVTAGAVTMVVGGWRAVRETDLKRILAYSTVSALGILMLLLGLGTKASIAAAFVYLAAHACYKGALFLVAGAVDHETGTRDISRLGGLGQRMPITAFAALLAALSMAGVPVFVGFVSKEALYESSLDAGSGLGLWLLAAEVGASALMGAAALMAGLSPFFRRPSESFDVHEPPVALWLGPMVLGLAGLMPLMPAAVSLPLDLAAASVLREPTIVSLSLWHGVTTALMLSLLTLAAALGIYRLRRHFAAWHWPRIPGPERIYAGTIGLADRVSTAISPALQSGSLRSYALGVIVGAGILVGGALLMGGAPRALAVTTGVRAHEALIVLLILVGAISAALARSSMTAVLSLGTVGYGVALMFLFFGAPDLAMTQFSVETLTVVIFVFVFYHFQRFDRLSSPGVRARDAVVAVAFGTIVAVLVLLVATSGTASRLTPFFVEMGPTLAHGRNIVNVILVDFRAMDTLGEITVLTTAAIGVRALVGLGAFDNGGAASGARDLKTSVILRTGTRLMMPLLLLFAMFLLARGHNQPGGGFVAALVVSAAFAIYSMAYGVEAARRALLVHPERLLGVGLLVALVAGLAGVASGHAFLTARWTYFGTALGTPLLFDIGVFLVVVGVVLTMVFTLAEE